MPKNKKRSQSNVQRFLKYLRNLFKKPDWRKVLTAFASFIILLGGLSYGIARWYQDSQAQKPLKWGVSFIPSYARYLGVDSQELMDAVINDLGISRFRLVSYWSEIEAEQGAYNFDELDWQFDKIEQAGGEITLAIGLRQPRWPECHMPDWAKDTKKDFWYPKLLAFMEAVVNRYKGSPALASYQLENEFHLEQFGECPDHDRARLIEEFNFIEQLDPSKPIIVTRSNNLIPSWPVGKPRADKVGAAIYKRTWGGPFKSYYYIPLPSWYYAFLAGGTKLSTGRDSFIHELQAEPWLPNGQEMATAALDEQDKTMNPEILVDTLRFAESTGFRNIDLWGVEWWYFRKIVHGDPAIWQTGKNYLNTD